MQQPRVSIIILTYNRPRLIGRAIASVRSQDCQGWEILVVHDGPDQETIRTMGEWEQADSRIRYLHRAQRGNIADATNFGILHARGEYIAILDDDDYWGAEDKLSRQMAFLDANPDHVACGGGAIVIDENGRETLRYLKPRDDRDIRTRALLANPMVHSTIMYRRAASLAVGGYNESLAGFQDWDFVLKLGQAGKLHNLQSYLTYYSLWQSGGSFQQQVKNTRSGIRIVWSHKGRYANAVAAMGMMCLYHAYAHLPQFARRHSYTFLARMKKSRFSAARRAGAEG